jgi:hypothetical protein
MRTAIHATAGIAWAGAFTPLWQKARGLAGALRGQDFWVEVGSPLIDRNVQQVLDGSCGRTCTSMELLSLGGFGCPAK